MSALVDERGLEVLDFQRIRERYAGQTHAPRSYAAALECEPATDFALVRRLTGETTEMRALAQDAGFSMQRIDDVDEAVSTAARGVPLPARELRAIGDALGSAAAAVKAIREADTDVPLLRARCAPFRALPLIVNRITDAIDERGNVLDRASPALGRIRRSAKQAQDDAREHAAAIARSSRYASAIQDAIVTMRDGRYVVPVKAEFAGQVQGIVHDTSSSGQTLFVEPLESLEANNRVRALRVQEEVEVARILAELSSLVAAESTQIATDVEVYVELGVMDPFRVLIEFGTPGAATDRLHFRHFENEPFGNQSNPVGLRERNAGIEQRVDGEGPFIEGRKEGARQQERSNRRDDYSKADCGHKQGRMVERRL